MSRTRLFVANIRKGRHELLRKRKAVFSRRFRRFRAVPRLVIIRPTSFMVVTLRLLKSEGHATILFDRNRVWNQPMVDRHRDDCDHTIIAIVDCRGDVSLRS